MMFPPQYLHNRVSAHYIEINQIFFTEMLKRYQSVRKDVLDEREQFSDQEKRTKYVSNSNYIYEPLGKDAPEISALKAQNIF